jgi:hypothetical protein
MTQYDIVIVLKKLNLQLNQDSIKTLTSINDALEEIESGKAEELRQKYSLQNFSNGNPANSLFVC